MTFTKKLLTLFVALMAFTSVAQAEGWSKQEFKVNGSWSIEQRTDGNYIVLSDDFKTKNAPDLKIFLSSQPYAQVNGKNATNGAVLVSQLSSNKGAQSYKIPDGINVDDYQSLLIHCEQYSKLWASTPLN